MRTLINRNFQYHIDPLTVSTAPAVKRLKQDTSASFEAERSLFLQPSDNLIQNIIALGIQRYIVLRVPIESLDVSVMSHQDLLGYCLDWIQNHTTIDSTFWKEQKSLHLFYILFQSILQFQQQQQALEYPVEVIKGCECVIKAFMDHFTVVRNYAQVEKLYLQEAKLCQDLIWQSMAFGRTLIQRHLQSALITVSSRFSNCRNERSSDRHYDDIDLVHTDSYAQIHRNVRCGAAFQSHRQQSGATCQKSASLDNLILATNRQELPAHDILRLVQSIKLLRILSRSDFYAKQMADRPMMVIRYLADMMRSFPDQPRVQMECTAVLANIASVTEHRGAILSEGCLTMIIRNMKRFIDEPEVETEICAAMSNFALFGT